MRLNRIAVVALVIVAAAAATAAGKKAAKDEAEALITKSEQATNAHDAKAFSALLDKDYFGASIRAEDKFDSPKAMQEHMEKVLAAGGTLKREGLSIKTDASGDAAWFIADYTFTPTSGEARKLRSGGVMIRHGKEWKLAMSMMSPLPAAK